MSAAPPTTESEPLLSDAQSSMLDLLRGVAAQVVLVGHTVLMMNFHWWFEDRFHVQSFAVVAFFILSGFLITLTALEKVEGRTYTFKEFFIDRASRIYTPYVPALVLILLVDLWARDSVRFLIHWSNSITPQNFVANLLMLQDFGPMLWLNKRLEHPITSFGSGRPLWTVAIEWWLYMAFGYAVLVSARGRLTLKRVLVLAALMFVPFLLAVFPRGDSLLWAWLGGSAFAYLYIRRPRPTLDRPRLWLIFFGSAAAGTARLAYSNDPYDVSATLLFLVTFAAGLYLCRESRTLLKLRPLAVALGAISYSLYLTHHTIAYVITGVWRTETGWPELLTSILVSNLVAIFIYFLFERHYPTIRQALKRRFMSA